MTELSLAIIGTAGRKDDANKLDRNVFKAMCIVAEELIKQLRENNYPITHLVSGGAAWSDHVAVKMYLDKKVNNLRLYIPCKFEGVFVEEFAVRSTGDWNTPVETLNKYHSAFMRKTNIKSMSDIKVAEFRGAEIITTTGGFKCRNAMVAKSDIILAMTYGDREVVKEGGTADTVRQYVARVKKEGFFCKAFHYNLSDGNVYTKIGTPKKIKKKLFSQ